MQRMITGRVSSWNAVLALPAVGITCRATRATRPTLYNRFTVSDAATYFFEGSGDQPAFNRHNDAFEDIGGFDTADANLVSVCNQAKENDRITVFTIAFEAPENGRTALQNCAIPVKCLVWLKNSPGSGADKTGARRSNSSFFSRFSCRFS